MCVYVKPSLPVTVPAAAPRMWPVLPVSSTPTEEVMLSSISVEVGFSPR